MRLRSVTRKYYQEHANIIIMRPVEHNALCTRAAASDGRTIYTYIYIHIQFALVVLVYVFGARSGSPQIYRATQFYMFMWGSLRLAPIVAVYLK